jgi:subtilisin family serine protease
VRTVTDFVALRQQQSLAVASEHVVGLSTHALCCCVRCLLFLPYAASAPSAVTVGAHDVKSQMAGFSNYGSCVDIFAPGVGIYSSTIPNTYATW